MKNLYVVLVENENATHAIHPPFFEFKTENQQEALDLCIKKNIPHFYELKSKDDIFPTTIWEIKKTQNGHELISKNWAEEDKKHQAKHGY